jgi:hypothetical protein
MLLDHQWFRLQNRNLGLQGRFGLVCRLEGGMNRIPCSGMSRKLVSGVVMLCAGNLRGKT